MPLAPCALTHPQPVGEGRGEGSLAGRARGPGPVSRTSPGSRRAAEPRLATRPAVRPGRGRVWRGEGVSGRLSGGRPAPGTPSPTPLPPAVPGPRQRKTKTRAEETAAGAPPEKPEQKPRASRPRCPAAGGLAPPPGSVPPVLTAPCPSRPLACFRPSHPSTPDSSCSGPLPGLPPAEAPRSGARGARAHRAPQAVQGQRGRSDPGLAARSPAATGPAHFPGPAPSPGGAGAPGGAGSRPGRRRLHSSGGSGGSAAGARLGAPAGTREGRGRGRGRARCGPPRGPPPRPSPFPPPTPRSLRGAPAASLKGHRPATGLRQRRALPESWTPEPSLGKRGGLQETLARPLRDRPR